MGPLLARRAQWLAPMTKQLESLDLDLLDHVQGGADRMHHAFPAAAQPKLNIQQIGAMAQGILGLAGSLFGGFGNAAASSGGAVAQPVTATSAATPFATQLGSMAEGIFGGAGSGNAIGDMSNGIFGSGGGNVGTTGTTGSSGGIQDAQFADGGNAWGAGSSSSSSGAQDAQFADGGSSWDNALGGGDAGDWV